MHNKRMRIRQAMLTGGAVFGVGASLFLGAHTAQAEVSYAVSRAVIDSALQNMGTEPVSDELSNRLAEGFAAAVAAGLVNQEIIDAVAGLMTNTASATPSNDVIDSTEELLDAHLEVDQRLWDTVSPDWVQAFETIRVQYESCCAEGTSKPECTRTLGQLLQTAHRDARIAEQGLSKSSAN